MVVMVQEGLCTLVPCTFLPGSLYLGKRYRSWFQKGADLNRDPPVATDKPQLRVQERTRGRFFLIGNPEDGNCSLSIRDVNVGDSGAYVFVAEAPLRAKQIYPGNEFSLEVTGRGAAGVCVGPGTRKTEVCPPGLWGGGGGTAHSTPAGPRLFLCFPALTHKPHIRIPGSLESGRSVNLSCSAPWACEQGTPPIFSWTSAALTSLGPRTPLSSALSLTPRPQDHGTRLACQVTLPGVGVTAEATVQLSVSCE
ncbi:Myeloid cell surface antigen CD33 [Galemys pyrenaicus]|uniref:Myeloid cell surface antigen CD33 n=1 Tax=Galemys pyrenaicus TaxID=202257 RepID=A0A8J6DM52_GALPY|nr:Myeloid cell surface antigen CD33 [Galemys pyrenaicus]